MKTHLFIILFAATAALTACDDDPGRDGRTQTFKDIELDKTMCAPCDTISAVVNYEDKGHSVFRAKYYYEVHGQRLNSNADSVYSDSAWEVVDPTKTTPKFRFAAPDRKGYYTLVFGTKNVNFSTGGPNGELFGAPSSVRTTFQVK